MKIFENIRFKVFIIQSFFFWAFTISSIVVLYMALKYEAPYLNPYFKVGFLGVYSYCCIIFLYEDIKRTIYICRIQRTINKLRGLTSNILDEVNWSKFEEEKQQMINSLKENNQ